MKHYPRLLFIIISLSLLATTSCVKEDFDGDKMTGADLETAWCAHVVHSDLSIYNLINVDSFSMINKDDKNFITLIYKNTILSKAASELIKIPGQYYSNVFSHSLPVVYPINSTAQATYHTEFDFSVPNSMVIDSVLLGKTNLHVHFTTNINANLNITISTSYVNSGGHSLSITIPHKFSGSPPEIIDTNVDLSGYNIIFNNAGAVKNKFPFDILVKTTSLGNTVNNPYSLTTGLNFDSIRYQKVFGYLGQITTSMDTGAVKIRMFENNVNGSYQFMDPKLRVTVKNSFGIPVRLNLNKIIAHSDNNSPFDISLVGAPGIWDVNAPTVPGRYDSTFIELNKNNSNILNAFTISPGEFKYQFDAHTNPKGNTGQNFALADSRLQVDGEVEMPLHFTAAGYILEDTVEENIMKDIGGSNSPIEFVNFIIRISSYFPLESKIQIYLVDSNKTWPAIDSLFGYNEVIIGAAAPGPAPDLKSEVPVTINKKISFTDARIKKWDNVRFFIIRATLDTYNNGVSPVKIYADYKFKVDIGIQTKLRLTFK